MKRTLIVVAHLDDETFGMGGTLAQMCTNDPTNVKVVALCSGRDFANATSRTEAFMQIQKKFGFDFAIHGYVDMELEKLLMKDVTESIRFHIDEFQPTRIFTLSENDIHQDHKIVSHATKIAARPFRTNVEEIYEFQTPGSEPYSSTYFDTINDVSEFIQIKYWMAQKYGTENIPQLEKIERFKTIYRKLDI